MKSKALAATTLVFALVACGGQPLAKPADPTSSATPTPSAAPTARIVYTYINNEDSAFLRFVVKVENPSDDEARVGVKVATKAHDEEGAIVGFEEWNVPPIPPGGSRYYVGGDTEDDGTEDSGTLSGTPVRVSVTIANEGHLDKSPPKPAVKVLAASFAPSGSFVFNGTREYDVSITIEALADVSKETLFVDARLVDADGKIVGAEWSDLNAMPEALSKGEKAKVIAPVTVENGLTPDRAEAFAYEDQ